MLLDTTFLIDFQRETTRGRSDRAYAFLDAHPDALLRTSAITCGEIAEGLGDERRDAFEELIRPCEVLDVTVAIAWRYGALSRDLRQRGAPIGDNDVWIAATALVHELPLVSRDASHFARNPGLRVLAY